MANLTIAEADVAKVDGPVKPVIFGATIAKGELVYPGAGNRYVLADANTDMGTSATLAMALTSGGDGNSGLILRGPVATVELGRILQQGKMYYVSETAGKICLETDLTVGTNEVQQIDVTGATAGTFTITFDGETTAAIPYNATNTQVKEALEELTNIDEVVTNFGPANASAITVEFQGVNSATNVPAMTLNTTNLTGATAPAVTTPTPGVPGAKLAVVGYAINERELRCLFMVPGIKLAT